MTITNMDARMDPDGRKKLASGFWTHEYRVDVGEDVWKCDIHKLNQAVCEIIKDYRESQLFNKDPHRYLDTRFGSDTAYVYFSKHNKGNERHVYVKNNPFAYDLARKRDEMAIGRYKYGHTDWLVNSTTSSSLDPAIMKQQMERIRNELIQETLYGRDGTELGARSGPTSKKRDSTISFRKLVRNVPFTNGGKGKLLETLQKDFDHWAGKQREALFNG